jgi:fructose-bisphosphate aldolase, class I
MYGKKVRMSRLMRNKHMLLLAMDQGIEHGPVDFNEKNIDPAYVFEIASKINFTGFIVQKGVALRYWENYAGSTPLILKVNGRTSIVPKDEIYSSPTATVKDAISLGADAIGFTIYVGSPTEAQQIKDFYKIEQEAREYGMPVIMWAYPRGKHVKEEKSRENVAYAARVALELGADAVKVNYTGDVESFKWVVKSAGNMPVLSAGGSKLTDDEFLKKIKEVMSAGAVGFAVGRNIWQNDKPLEMAKKMRKLVLGE